MPFCWIIMKRKYLKPTKNESKMLKMESKKEIKLNSLFLRHNRILKEIEITIIIPAELQILLVSSL